MAHCARLMPPPPPLSSPPTVHSTQAHLDVHLPVWSRHLLLLLKRVVLHLAGLQAQQRTAQVALAGLGQPGCQPRRQRQPLVCRHRLQLLHHLLLRGCCNTDAQASAAHWFDDLPGGGAQSAAVVRSGLVWAHHTAGGDAAVQRKRQGGP
jgi:hypothetical protein